MPLRILIITQEDFLTGAMFSVSFLAKSLQERGHSVWVAARENSDLHAQVKKLGIPFLAITISSKLDHNAIQQLRAWVHAHGINVINAQSSKDRYVSVFARWLFQLPVTVVHTRRQVSLSVGGFLQNLIYQGGTDKVVAVSYGVKRSLVAKGMSSQHIRVIRNGTPSYKFTVSPLYVSRLREEYQIKPGDWVIGCIARRKKQEQVLLALREIEHPVKVFFVGFEEDDQLRSLRSGLHHTIFYPGSLPAAEALPFLHLFTCYVLCSTTEGLSQSLLEAMYAQVPVVTTAAAGNLDLIKHERNGLLFEDANVAQLAASIKRVHQNHELRDRIVARARRQVTTYYSMDRVAQEYVELFTSLLSSRKKRQDASRSIAPYSFRGWLRSAGLRL